jgi:hypothetical protein
MSLPLAPHSVQQWRSSGRGRDVDNLTLVATPQGLVVVIVNGQRLLDLVDGDRGEGHDPLPEQWVLADGHRIWIGEPGVSDDLVRSDGVAVLNCSCGVLGCGAVYARQRVGAGKVIWSDFHTANGEPLDVPRFQLRYTDVVTALASLGRPNRGT